MKRTAKPAAKTIETKILNFLTKNPWSRYTASYIRNTIGAASVKEVNAVLKTMVDARMSKVDVTVIWEGDKKSTVYSARRTA